MFYTERPHQRITVQAVCHVTFHITCHITFHAAVTVYVDDMVNVKTTERKYQRNIHTLHPTSASLTVSGFTIDTFYWKMTRV